MNLAVVFLGAAGLAALLVALSRPFARYTRAVSKVKPDRWHAAGEIPRLGGPPLLLALSPWLEYPVTGVLAAFCAVGVWDDYRPLSAPVKASMLVIPCALASWLTGEAWVGVVCWVSANALNLLDHADGTAASASAASMVVEGGALGLSGAGAGLGFLVHNWPAARAFLGDSGSLMLGALLVLVWYPYGLLPLLAGLALPLVDAAFVIVRRLMKHRPPWHGGTDHTGHVLLRAGVPPGLLPVVYGVAAGILAMLGKLYS